MYALMCCHLLSSFTGHIWQIMQQTNLIEQQPEDLRSTASASPTGLMSSAMKKKQDEKLLFQEAQIPNPYNMVGR